MSTDDKNKNEKASDVFNTRGIAAAERQWHEEAIKAFKRAIELDPLSGHAHDNLASVYSEQGEYLLALGEYVEALRLEPDNPTAHYNLACFLITFGKQMAMEQYGEALRLDPEYPDAHVNRGLCFAESGDHESAIEAFSAACALDPDDPVAKQELAASRIDLGQFSDAIRLLKEVIKQAPENTDALIDLGIAHTEQGFFEEAEKAFHRACESDPEDALAAYHFAGLFAAWERPEAALTQLAKALQLDPKEVCAWADSDRLFDDLREEPRFMALLEAALD